MTLSRACWSAVLNSNKLIWLWKYLFCNHWNIYGTWHGKLKLFQRLLCGLSTISSRDQNDVSVGPSAILEHSFGYTSRDKRSSVIFSSMQHLSSYTENLSDEVKTRYKEKITLVNGQDPFAWCSEGPSDVVPSLEARDLVRILLSATD